MKKILIAMTIIFIGAVGLFIASQQAYAVSVPVSAVVASNSPEVVVEIKLLTSAGQEPSSGTTVPSMSFGTLAHILPSGVDAGSWFSNNYFAALIYTGSFGNRYEIKSTCTGLVSGGNSLPTGSFGLTPGYAAADRWDGADPATAQGPQPVGSVLGTAGPAIATNKSIYRSETAASNRILRAFYSIPPKATGGADPYTGHVSIPLTQPSGTYSGTVTITIAAY